jgi:hypothetical protein
MRFFVCLSAFVGCLPYLFLVAESFRRKPPEWPREMHRQIPRATTALGMTTRLRVFERVDEKAQWCIAPEARAKARQKKEKTGHFFRAS